MLLATIWHLPSRSNHRHSQIKHRRFPNQPGALKRREPERPEAGLLMRALRDSNLAKIVQDDMFIFMGLLSDLFPECFNSMPRERDADFERLVAEAAVAAELQPQEYFVQNVVDLQERTSSESPCPHTSEPHSLPSARVIV